MIFGLTKIFKGLITFKNHYKNDLIKTINFQTGGIKNRNNHTCYYYYHNYCININFPS